MEDVGGNHKDKLSIEMFGGYKTAVNERIETRERLALRNKIKRRNT